MQKKFEEILEKKIKGKITLKIVNDNKLILHVRKTEREKAVKINRCFLDAPEEIIDAVAGFILGNKKRYHRRKLVRFAREKISAEISDKAKIEYEGEVYNLREIFDFLNAKHFNNSITSKITFGRRFNNERSRSIVFGNYNPKKNLIRINRALDSHLVPEFFVRYIVFHEMLHAHMYLSGSNSPGHSKRFKKKELSYPEIKIAEKWKKENLDLFIKSANVQQTE
ncbi:MAG: SprT-like domain-containing protein [Candidatus Omnitrophica bacterium]|nr:SprT-like domain-containing protein [Candidatus Omnitrophota bacterium]MCM8827748.1 SprT-like domain-containing protein [Candidatus Omnitrophota bacterium]